MSRLTKPSAHTPAGIRFALPFSCVVTGAWAWMGRWGWPHSSSRGYAHARRLARPGDSPTNRQPMFDFPIALVVLQRMLSPPPTAPSTMAFRALRLTATLSVLLLTACSQPPPYTGGAVAELQRIDVATGQGAVAMAGDEVSVHYTGWLYDQNAADKRGQKFDSSRDRGQPFVFMLGAGRVIRGWDEGVAGMRVGGKRELHIPAALGYGRDGAGDVIPPGASLVFEVELLDVRK